MALPGSEPYQEGNLLDRLSRRSTLEVQYRHHAWLLPVPWASHASLELERRDSRFVAAKLIGWGLKIDFAPGFYCLQAVIRTRRRK